LGTPLNLLYNIVNANSNTVFDYMVYDTLRDIWTPLQGFKPTGFTPQTSLTSTGTLSGITSVAKNGVLHIFGKSQSYITIDVSTNIMTIVAPLTKYTFGDNVYSFVHDDTIYVTGMYNDGKETGYNIFSFNEDNYSFRYAQTLSPDALFPGNGMINAAIPGQRGGVIPFYTDGKIFVLYGDTVAYLDLNPPHDVSYSGKIIIDKGTSLFDTTLPQSRPPFYFPFTSGNCTFEMNGYIFLVTGSGEIFRGFFDPVSDNKINLIITPCYGVSNYGRPIDKQLQQT
tara:strand:+ start:39 stop:887 length:849 start_codon:yes stop_codon:yes gene_type:complete